MNDSPNSDSPKGKPRRRKVSKWIKIPLFCFVLLITVAVAFIAIQNWRAERAWSEMQKQLEESGEAIELEDIIPPEVPDEENFAMTPLIAPLLKYRHSRTNGQTIWLDEEGKERAEAGSLQGVAPEEPYTENGRINLKAWGEAFRESDQFTLPETSESPAEDVLAALTEFDEELEELARATLRPHSHFPVHYEEYFNALLPYLSVLKSWQQLVSLRSAARLETGDIHGAYEDVLFCMRLSETLRDENLLISFLVRIAMHNVSTRAFWQGWVDHRWTSEQLAEFQDRFQSIEWEQSVVRVIRAERTLGTSVMETWIEDDRGQGGIGIHDGEFGFPVRVLPRSFIRFNQVALNRFYLAVLNDLKAANEEDRLWKESDEGYLQETGLDAMSPYSAIARAIVPVVNRVLVKQYEAQVLSSLAATVCALERHRIDHGEYPVSLEALVPDYMNSLPIDWMSGEPFRYEKRDDGWFNLYSVGYNEVDDGGVHVPRETETEGDLPWPLPLEEDGEGIF